MPEKHALLGPSSSKRWLECNPSARLTENFDETQSSFAQEGTLAHSFCEYKLSKAMGRELPVPEKNEFYSEEIEECSNAYVSYVMELYEEAKTKCKDPILLVEQEVSLQTYVPESFGTCDALIVADDTLYVIDYKHGCGVLVSAEYNTQMMLYALGALSLFDSLYDITNIHMTIFQPRLSNISTFEMKKDKLLDWAENELKPRALRAFNGEGEFQAGDWCRFCKAKAICKERANSFIGLAHDDFIDPALLTDDEIEEVLAKSELLVSWANDVKDFALEEALKGKKWKSFKLVAGRSNRKFSDDDIVIQKLENAGVDPFEKKLMSITNLQKKLGKVKFDELLGELIIKPEGAPTLVSRNDKRAEIEISSAENDFKESK